MSNIYLKVPNIEDIHYKQKWMQDPKTMSYNAGYEVDIEGYDNKTGTITKTDKEMINWYNDWINNPDKYYAYIYNNEIEEPIGEVCYYLYNGIYSMGILIQDKYKGKGYSYDALLELEKVAFEENNISELFDMIPTDRTSALKTFQKAGFICTDYGQVDVIFGKEIVSKQFLITKEMYFANKDIMKR